MKNTDLETMLNRTEVLMAETLMLLDEVPNQERGNVYQLVALGACFGALRAELSRVNYPNHSLHEKSHLGILIDVFDRLKIGPGFPAHYAGLKEATKGLQKLLYREVEGN